MRGTLEQRFWARVRKGRSCWIWTGARDQRGYGRLQRGARGHGHIKAHRLSYELHNGPFDDALFVCHRCDNPSCVNPAHLFLGTHRDNMDDATEKLHMGRPPVLDTDALAAFMRDGGTYRSAAAHFGVPTSTIYRTLRRHGLLSKQPGHGGVKKAAGSLMDAAAIARELGVSYTVAEKIMRQLPKVQPPDVKKTYVWRHAVEKLLEEYTFDVVTRDARRRRNVA